MWSRHLLSLGRDVTARPARPEPFLSRRLITRQASSHTRHGIMSSSSSSSALSYLGKLGLCSLKVSHRVSLLRPEASSRRRRNETHLGILPPPCPPSLFRPHVAACVWIDRSCTAASREA
ncbi:unnamed protein product [Protopolystoma xenopodis]|uniref:Uncharacterized protein n=1 Tax=Protopolystoma xenopodis TaxID=117903 RepID=A0A3S5C7G5_9PLAT|nr:unnamed protein product [Protopolystoma xenopodis]